MGRPSWAVSAREAMEGSTLRRLSGEGIEEHGRAGGLGSVA